MRNYMKINLFIFTLLLMAFTATAFASHVVLMPDSVLLAPKEGMHFRAQIFADNGDIIRVALDKYKWSVAPDYLGTISDDGFFIAGKKPGKAKVYAAISHNGQRYVGEADVWIGRVPKPQIDIIIQPKRAVVPPGDTLQFKVSAVNSAGRKVIIKHVRWDVQPSQLGRINNRGFFEAGENLMDGHVIAKVEIEGQTIKKEARVIVSPKPKSVISGTILEDETGTPIEKARVWAHRIGKIRWNSKTRTNENGEYTLKRLIPGKYVIYTSARNYINEWYNDVRHYDEATPVEVAEKDTVSAIDFDLTHGASITGTVTVQDADAPLEGVHVVTYSILTPRQKHHAVTNENGEFTIEGLISGSYLARAGLEGYHKEYYLEKTNAADADVIAVTEPDATADIDFTLSTATAICGVVVDAQDGSPIKDAEVYAKSILANTNPTLIIHRSRTNANGEYTIQVARAGKYLVGALAKGYHGEMYQDAYRVEDATPVTVELDLHTTGIDFDLAHLGEMSGRVVSETTGEPIEGALVQAYREALRISYKNWPIHITRTDSDGYYTLPNLPSGKYIVKSSAREYLTEFYNNVNTVKEATLVEVADSTVTGDIDFTLTSGGILSGLVASATDSSGLVKAMVCVRRVRPDSALRHHKNFVSHTFTKDDGTYELRGLPTGEYIVWAKARGYHSRFYDDVTKMKDATKVTVTASNETAGIDFYLPEIILNGSVISGTVATETLDTLSVTPTDPIEGAWVVAIPVSRNFRYHFPYWAVTDENGDYTFTNLRPGKYVVAAWARGYLGEYYDDVRRWHRATRLEVKENTETTDIDFVLDAVPAGAYCISGQITDAAGVAIEHALVYANSDSGAAGFGYTDADGYYSIDNLVPGEYIIEVDRVEYDEASSSQPVTVGNGKEDGSMDFQLVSSSTGVENDMGTVDLPVQFELSQNYPNPFNPVTHIQYQLPMDAKITLRVFNLLGQDVRTLVDKPQKAGLHGVQWDGKDKSGNVLPSGLYFYQIKAVSTDGTNFQKILKMSLIK